MRDVPDLVAWKDFRRFPTLTHQLLSAWRDQSPPAAHSTLRFPKPSGGYRVLTLLHPFDEIAIRTYCGRLIPALKVHRAKSVVSPAPRGRLPAWALEPYQEARRTREALGLASLDSAQCVGLGVLDVASFFPSVDLDVLVKILWDFGCPAGAMEQLHRLLSPLRHPIGPGGLPLGLEASPVLADAFLAKVDTVLEDVLPFLRYVDDFWLFPESQSEWEEAKTVAIQALTTLGLAPNESKTEYMPKGWSNPWNHIRNEALNYATETSDGSIASHIALDMLAEEASKPEANPRVVRFSLGVLKRNRCPDGVTELQKAPHLAEQYPHQVGAYLVELARTNRKALDLDWLVEISSCPPTHRTDALAMEGGRALSHLRTGRRSGEQLRDLAADDRFPEARRMWAAMAWGKSDHFKSARAVELVEASDSFHVRRASTLAFKIRNGSERHVAKLVEVDPILELSVA